MRRTFAIYVAAQVMATLVTLPLRDSLAESDLVFSLASSDFQNGQTIPERYTCSGLNTSPALEWSGVPSSARSLVLTVDDPDAPGGTFVHWVIYNLSPESKELPEGISSSARNTIGEQGTNGRDEVGYAGPCPPPGKPHHYHFRLYALDQKLQLGLGATEAQVEAAMKGHVLGNAELVGVFER
jgi:Raf kinase inhibitor-like YbhB/YbcL family protein